MISVEHIVAMALRNRTVLDQLGEALRSDLVLANPFYRQIAVFADDFLLMHHKLPEAGDWDLWLQSLVEGMSRDGVKEALGRLLALDLSAFTPEYFAPAALEHLQKAAVQVARARLNEMTDVPIETFTNLAAQIEKIELGGVRGLARLADLETWCHPLRDQDLTPTGFPTLDRLIGGWGKELWIMFADSGKGKSMLLQNCLANAARTGKRGLHVSLEIGIRPQIHRYYRQLAQATQADFRTRTKEVRQAMQHWLRLAQGEIMLLEFPAYSLDPDGLKRTVERLSRAVGDIDIVALDYLDLLTLPRHAKGRGAYEDLGRITHEVRGLCSAFDLTVLSASQSVRRPEKADRLTVRDMGDSYNKVRGADGLLSLVQTSEEEETHQGRLGVLKARDSGGRGTEVPLYINQELAIIQELDHPNTVELMTRLGHLITPGGTP
jgi:hypothetical protein